MQAQQLTGGQWLPKALTDLKPIDKQRWLTLLEERIERHWQAALQFQNLDEAILQQPAHTGGWGVSQCLSHLNSYGQYYLPRLRKAIDQQQNSSSSNTFSPSWLGAYLTRMIDPDCAPKKYKAVPKHQPNNAPGHATVAEFIDQQEELIRLLRAVADTNPNTGRISISVMPLLWLSVGDVLQFMVFHNERHIRQAMRSLNGR